jgi:transposase InsO family protein
MAFPGEKPTNAFGAPQPRDVSQASRQARRRKERAQRRFQIAKAAASHSGSMASAYRFIERAVESGLIPAPVPSEANVRALSQRWKEGEQSVADYLDNDRKGRPRFVLPGKLEKLISDTVKAGRKVNARRLAKTLSTIAAAEGLPAPTYYQVHRRIAEEGRLVRAAARHGSRAGEIDGMPQARIVTRAPHDTWAIDELTVPVWARAYVDQRWVSILCDVVLVVDVFSSVVVGYHLVDPTRRLNEFGVPMRQGFDSSDVMAALYAASCRELGSDATREFAGYLPDRIRWDNAQAHKTVRKVLTATAVGIDVQPIRKRRAASNGAVERPIGVLKPWCDGLRGFVDDYLPLDQITSRSKADQPTVRSKLTGYTPHRGSRRQPIQPEHLLSVDELRVEFDRVVRDYNFVHRNRARGHTTGLQRYMRGLTHNRPRRGHDMILTIEPQSTVVTRDGIVHTHEGVTYQFFPLVPGRLLLLDTLVSYRPDPLGRGIFLEEGADHLFLAPVQVIPDEDAAVLAQNKTAVARLISDNAERLRDEQLALEIGPENVNSGREAVALRVEELSMGDTTPSPSQVSDTIGASEEETLDLLNDPFMSADPAAILRTAADDEEYE